MNPPHRSLKSLLPVTLTASLTLITLVWLGCAPKFQLTPLEPAAPPVTGDSGMVVAAHPLAAEAGVSVLRDGGNAVDAAIASLFMLNVVEPYASGLGGGGFALVRSADGSAKVVIYRETTPKGMDATFYTDPADTSHNRMQKGGSAVLVPGAAAGWAELYDHWATLPLERLARDAIRAADSGFVVDKTLAAQITSNLEKIQGDSALIKTFLKDGVVPYAAGDTLRQRDLAMTFRTLVQRGLRSFYRGPIAEAVVKANNDGGGKMTEDDLAFYRAEVTDPVRAQYAGYELLTTPPPSGGGTALAEALNLFDLTGATGAPQGSRAAVHLMSQCILQAYADADAVIEDGCKEGAWKSLLSADHLRRAAEGISATAKPSGRKPILLASAAQDDETKLADVGNTTHLVVVDRFGNAVSLTQSIDYFFGAGVMAAGTGLLLNNHMADFNLPPDTVNLLAPRKRPRSNMAPLILLKGGKPVLVLGTPGGARIVSTLAQISAGITAYNQDISAAIDYPRFYPIYDHRKGEAHLVMESRFALDAVKGLWKSGYKIHPAGPYHNYFGGAHGIAIDPVSGKLYGAADRRRGGAARGY